MKILCTIPNLQAGGAERVMTYLANYWAGKGHNVLLVTLDKPDAAPFYPLEKGVSHKALGVFYGGGRIYNTVKRIVSLRTLLKQYRPEVMVSFMDTMNITALVASFGLSHRRIISERIHPSFHPLGGMRRLLRRITYPFASALVVQTQEIKTIFSAWLKIPVYRIPNPVFPPPFLPQAVKKDGIKNKYRIIALGRLQPQKGYDILLNAFAAICKKFPAWELVIYGEGQDRPVLEALTQGLGIRTQVSMPGVTHDVAKALQEADMYVMASRYEGFPNALCEAMAAGLAVVCTDCPSGPSEIISHGKNGILVPPENSEALAGALGNMMGDSALRVKLGDEARRITEVLAAGTIFSQWDEILGMGKTC